MTGLNGGMLTEEALILLATLGATGILILGVVELVWPSRPASSRMRRARVAPTPDVDSETSAALQRLAPAARAARPAEPAEPSAGESPEPPASPTAAIAVDEPGPVGIEPTEAMSVIEPPVTSAAMPILEPPPTGGEPARHPVVAPERPLVRGEPRPQVLPIDACLAMYNERRFAEVVSLGSAALELHAGMPSVSDRPDETAALLDLVGLSKQELGDRDGARMAFRTAIRRAAPPVRETYVRHLIAVVRSVADLDLTSEDSDATRLRELRGCMAALDDALSVVPGDEGVRATQAMVRDALSPACERLVARVVSGDEDQEARELVLETLTDHSMPTAWREGLREQLTSVSSAEIGQLTAQAMRSVQEGKDAQALEALERAERLSEGLPSGAVAEERREEFERRLWWGYTRVGLRRIETGSFEAALEPLFRALRLGGLDEERLVETRGALARALEGVVDAGARTIRELGVGDLRAAHAEIEKLVAHLQTSLEHGMKPDELRDAFSKLSQLERSLSSPRA
jgi:hypothetical protein